MKHLGIRALARRARGLAWAAPLVLSAAACDTDVLDPSAVPTEAVNDAGSLPGLRAGALANFKTAYSGTGDGTEGIILLSGLRADEWRNADTFEGRQEVDRGTIQINNSENENVFRAMQQARLSAELAASRFLQFEGAPAQLAEMHSLAGFTYVMFAENYCSGIPFSSFDVITAAVTEGTALPTAEVYARAVARFDSALLARPAYQLALVGKARALLDAGQYAAAAALVTPTAVPTTFVYNVEHSENDESQNNGVYFLNNINRRWSVASAEGGNGIEFRPTRTVGATTVEAPDPRVPYSRLRTAAGTARNGLDARTPLFQQFKYAERSADIPLATGIEARLIEAEAALKANDRVTWLAKHNELRATRSLYRCPAVATPGYACPDTGFLLAPLPATLIAAPAAQAENVHFTERAFWLWSTAHRLGDMRRLVRPVAQGGYGRPYATVYPQGPYPKGGAPYGNAASFPIPVDERNNTNFANYEGCDVTVP